MKRKYLHVAGTIFTLLLGTLLHFTYEWSGNNPVVAIFSAVNESTWEHLKLVYTPILLFSFVEYFVYGKKLPNFILIKTLSIALAMCTIVVTFYTYVGIIGDDYLWADIATFVLATLIGYLFSYKQLQREKTRIPYATILGIIGILLIIACIVYFTFNPPHIPLFRDSQTGKYGL